MDAESNIQVHYNMAQPVFQRVKKTPTSEEFVKQLDELLRRNKGQFTNVGYDTSSQIPFMLEGGSVRNPLGIDEVPVARSSARLVEPPIYEEPLPETPEEPTSELDQFLGQLEQLPAETATPIASLPDGGTLYDNNTIVYSDGTVRDYQDDYDPEATPIASMSTGAVMLSDGSIRRQASKSETEILGISKPVASLEGNRLQYSDSTIRDMAGNVITRGANVQGGVEGLSQLAFGQQQPVTQEFGNINPIEPTPGNVNLGTDFRTRNLKSKDIKLPVNAKVVQVLEDDGTRFGDISGHKGYGNSVLVEMPTGERLRFSHLSSLGNVQVGQDLRPGELLGVTGATGNVTGEHLDLEYYNQQGQIDNPANFSGFQGQLKATDNRQLPFTSAATAPGQVLGASTPEPTPDYTRPETIANEQKTQQFQSQPFANIQKPVTTSQQPSQLEQVATQVNAPELGVSERSQAQGTNPYRQALGDLVDIAATPAMKYLGVPNSDKGLSEWIAGGATVNTGKDLIPAMASYEDEYIPAPSAQDYANVLGKNFQNVLSELGKDTQEVLALPGKGIDALKQGLSKSFFSRPETSQVGFERVIGEASPTESVLPVVQGNIKDQNRISETPVAGSSASFKPINTPAQSGGVSQSQSRSFSSASSPSAQKSSQVSTQSKGAIPGVNYTPAKPVSKPVAPKPAPASVAKPLNYTPASFTPVYNPPKPAPAPQSKPSVFSRVASAVKTFFRR